MRAPAPYLGLLAATMKDWAEAGRRLEDALAMNEKMRVYPWLAGPGDRERARELLERALAIYREHGVTRAAAPATERVG